MELKVGDWVRSYSKGIWQIIRIEKYFYLNPSTKKEDVKISIFSKRFLSEKMKRSFSGECCDPYFVRHVDQNTQEIINSFIKENQKVYNDFCNYNIKPIDCIYNARIEKPQYLTIEQIDNLFSKDIKYKEEEINNLLLKLGFNTEKMPYWTVQFVSENFDIENNYLMFKYKRFLAY